MLFTVCIGGAYWKKKCNKILGKWLGCTKWNKCKHKVPDTICIAKCKGKKVIGKVKGVAKQAGVEVSSPPPQMNISFYRAKCSNMIYFNNKNIVIYTF